MEKLKELNKAISEIEKNLAKRIIEIAHHLTKSYENGMTVYEDFHIDGFIYISPIDDSSELYGKFEKIGRAEAVSYQTYVYDPEWSLNSIMNKLSHFDYKYYEEPDNYPEDYVPRCKSFDHLILNPLSEGIITEDDVSRISEMEIFTDIKINI